MRSRSIYFAIIYSLKRLRMTLYVNLVTLIIIVNIRCKTIPVCDRICKSSTEASYFFIPLIFSQTISIHYFTNRIWLFCNIPFNSPMIITDCLFVSHRYLSFITFCSCFLELKLVLLAKYKKFIKQIPILYYPTGHILYFNRMRIARYPSKPVNHF